MVNIGLVNESLVNGVAGGVYTDPTENATATDVLYPSVYTTRTYSDSCTASESAQRDVAYFLSSLASATDVTAQSIAYRLFEVGVGAGVATTQLSAVTTYADHASAIAVVTQLVHQLISEAAGGEDTWFVGTAALLADVALASGLYTNRASVIQAVGEAVVAAEIIASGKQEMLSEGVAAAELVAELLRVTNLVLEQVVAADVSTPYLLLVNTVSEGVSADEAVTIWQRLTQSIDEGGSAFVSLSVSGEAYTGWVLNTANNAFSEYQGWNFNSLARISNRYFGASEDGIFELTGSTDAGENIATYIQTGLMDFGTSFTKSVQYAYIAADSEGRVALGISVAGQAAVTQGWYEVVSDNAAANNLKITIGRGLKGRYWKFDIASDALESFDAVTLLPVKLSRRV